MTPPTPTGSSLPTGVNEPVRPNRGLDVLQVFGNALDLAEDRIQRMLQRAVDLVALARSQFFQIRVDAIARLDTRLPVPALQVFDDLFAREDGLGDVVEHRRPGL